MDWPWDGLGRAAGCGHMLPLITCTNRIAVAVLCCTRRANSFLSLVDRILLNRGEPSSFSFLLVLLFAVLKFSARLALLCCCCSLDEEQTKKSCTFSQHLQTHKADAQKLYLVRISEFCLYILFSIHSPIQFSF